MGPSAVILPGTQPSDTAGVFAVLALISNPEASRKRLAEIIEATKSFEAKRTESYDAAKQLEEERRAIERHRAALSSTVQSIDERETAIAHAKAQVDSAAENLQTRSEALEDDKKNLANLREAMSREHDKRITELSLKSGEMAEKIRAAELREAQAMRMKVEFERKLRILEGAKEALSKDEGGR